MEEYRRLLEAGVLREGDPGELSEGEILEMSPMGSRHVATVNGLARFFFSQVGDRAMVSVQNPIRLGEVSEPQPDLALLPRPDDYAAAFPQGEDALLLVEVADPSQAHDREVKPPLYAKAGIAEVGLLDLVGGRLEVYRKPSPEGYRERHLIEEGEVALLAFPEARLALKRVLP